MQDTSAVAEPLELTELSTTTRSRFHIVGHVFTVLILAAIVSAFAYIQVRTFTPGYREPDPDGYIILAKRMAQGGPLGVVDSDPFVYQSHVWVENGRGEILPKFAPGFSALMALFYKLSGNNDEAMFAVSPVMGALAVIGAFLLFREWLPVPAALIATATFAFNRTFVFYSSYLLAHAVDLCFVTWGMYFLWVWMRAEKSTARRDVLFAILAGLTLGYACLVRHTSGLLALAVGAALVSRLIRGIRKPPLRVRSLLALAIAYAIFPMLLMAYNWRFFGNPLRTGYDLSGEQLNFSWDNLVDHFTILGHGLSFDLLFMLFPMGLIAIFFVGPADERIVRSLWFLPLYVVYSAYYWAPENTAYYRFLIPVISLFVGAAFMLIERLRIGTLARGGVMLVVFVMVVMQGHDYFARALGFDIFHPTKPALFPRPPFSNNPHVMPTVDAGRAMEVLNDDAVIFAESNLRDYVGTRKHFRLYALQEFTPAFGTFFQTKGRPQEYTPLMQETRRLRLRDMYNSLTPAQLHAKQTELMHQYLDAGKQVVVLSPSNQLPQIQQNVGSDFSVSIFKPLEIRGFGQWTLYDVKLKPPATNPATQP